MRAGIVTRAKRDGSRARECRLPTFFGEPPESPSMNKSPAKSPPAPAREWDDDAEPWRHPPVAPRDEGIADSIGKAISDVVISPLDEAKDKPKPIPRS
jgi:hypothetical protein